MTSLRTSDGYAPAAHDVLLTNATQLQEQTFVEQLTRTYASLAKTSEEYLIFPTAPHYHDDPFLRKSILITPTAANYADIMTNTTRNPHYIQRELSLSDGQIALRLSASGTVAVEQIIIPYPRNFKLPSGYGIATVIIQMSNNFAIYDQPAFDAVVNSFRYY